MFPKKADHVRLRANMVRMSFFVILLYVRLSDHLALLNPSRGVFGNLIKVECMLIKIYICRPTHTHT